MVAVYALFFREVRVSWDMTVALVTHSLVRAWEPIRGVRGPPVGTDKDGGGSIRVVWCRASSLSAAEMLHFFCKFPFVFADKLFHSSPHVETKREEALIAPQAGFIQRNQGKLVGGV